MATYFVRTRGRVTGPFDRETLQKLARRGAVSRVHEVSADRVNWSSAGEYEDLFPTPAAGVLGIAPRPATEPAQAVSGPAAATPVELDPLPGIAPAPPPPPAPVKPSRRIANLTPQAPLPAPLLHPPAQTDPAPDYKRWAVAALVTAICGVPLFGLVTGVLAMVFAINALKGMQRTGNDTGKGMALAGFVLGMVDFLGWLIYLILVTLVFR